MEWLDKYIKKIKENKFNAVLGGLAIGLIMFVIFFIYNKFTGRTMEESFIIGGILGLVFFFMMMIFSLDLVRREKKRENKKAIEKEKEIEKRREKLAQGKVNNKKKKKNK